MADTNPIIVNTVEENATDFISKVNTFFAEYGIKNEDGSPAVLTALAGSPTWLFCLAQGQNTTEWQERLRKAWYAIDIDNCPDEQVYVLATLAGVLFKEQSAPMITLNVYNPTEDNLTINSTNCYAEDSFGQNKWYSGSAYTLAVGETAPIIFYCEDKEGSVPPNTSFILKSTNVPASFTDITITPSLGSTILFEGETPADLRRKIQQGSAGFDHISQAQKAIENLNGIAQCSIYFNPDANESVTLEGGILLPPRTAFVVVKGVDVDDLLAYAYFKYMDIATLNTSKSLVSYTIVGASTLPVYYQQATTVHPYVKIKIQSSGTSNLPSQAQIRSLLLEHANEFLPGKPITAQKLDYWINEGNTYIAPNVIITSSISRNGSSYSDVFLPDVYESIELVEDRIVFEEIIL